MRGRIASAESLMRHLRLLLGLLGFVAAAQSVVAQRELFTPEDLAVVEQKWPEAKRGKQPNVRGALRQATNAAPPGRIPIAIIRDDRAEPFVALSLDDFLEFVAEWWARRDK